MSGPIERLLNFRFNPVRIAKRSLPWSIILALAVAGMGAAFSWTVGLARPSPSYPLLVATTVVCVIVGIIIVIGVPMGLWALAHRANAFLARLRGRKIIEPRKETREGT